MKKGKKMPSIELEGQSDARFVLIDGKIVRQEREAAHASGAGPPMANFERSLRD